MKLAGSTVRGIVTVPPDCLVYDANDCEDITVLYAHCDVLQIGYPETIEPMGLPTTYDIIANEWPY